MPFRLFLRVDLTVLYQSAVSVATLLQSVYIALQLAEIQSARRKPQRVESS